MNRLRIEMNRLLLNRLLSKGMSNICSKVTIETFSKLPFPRLKKFVTKSVFKELQLCRYH